MKKRLFDGMGRETSEVGLGCWQIGGSDRGEVDDRMDLAILERAVEEGITFLDTANVYGSGCSETLTGQLLEDLRGGKELSVATKA